MLVFGGHRQPGQLVQCAGDALLASPAVATAVRRSWVSRLRRSHRRGRRPGPDNHPATGRPSWRCTESRSRRGCWSSLPTGPAIGETRPAAPVKWPLAPPRPRGVRHGRVATNSQLSTAKKAEQTGLRRLEHRQSRNAERDRLGHHGLLMSRRRCTLPRRCTNREPTLAIRVNGENKSVPNLGTRCSPSGKTKGS